MKKINLLFGCLIMLSSCAILKPENKQTSVATADPANWKLLFADEFNSKGSFDTKKWAYATRGNPAWAKYLTSSADYVSQDGSNLVLRMDNAVIPGDTVPYHSGGIHSSTKFSMLYGKVEVRAKFSKGKGSWPAIWMMPEVPTSYGDWPNSGEIDIMEHVNNEPVLHQTIHNGAVTDAKGGSTATHSAVYKETDFNVYGIVWTPSAIAFYINDVLQYTYAKPAGATSLEWPFDKPFYIILNQSGGAGWPGPITNADLPFHMEVDWVRAYQQK